MSLDDVFENDIVSDIRWEDIKKEIYNLFSGLRNTSRYFYGLKRSNGFERLTIIYKGKRICLEYWPKTRTLKIKDMKGGATFAKIRVNYKPRIYKIARIEEEKIIEINPDFPEEILDILKDNITY